MKGHFLLAALLCAQSLSASGSGEDASSGKVRTYDMASFHSIEMGGGINFEVTQGPQQFIEVRSNPALFDQLKVENWNGRLVIRVDTGLYGPKERGEVNVKIILKDPVQAIVLRGKSKGTLTVTQKGPLSLDVREESLLDAQVKVQGLVILVAWKGDLKIRGETSFLDFDGRSQSRAWAGGLALSNAKVHLGEGSVLTLTAPDQISGVLRESSQLGIIQPEGSPRPDVASLILMENSQLRWEDLATP